MTAFKTRLIFGLAGSLLDTRMDLPKLPALAVVSTEAEIVPVSPGFRWSELAITAVQPQEGVRLLIINTSFPAFLNWN